ncbi:MAG TPA: HAMP domain-containing protein [Candidatus Scatovivens faecipullorum]|nr:HAMP domain-containing protein [Candidatus Scatovivens faecipullorum]
MLKKVFKSVRAKLFFTLCVVILMLIGFFIIINNAVLEALYYYSKKESTLETYNYINENLSKILEEEKEKYELELEKIAINNNFEILIIGTDNNLVYSTNKNFVEDFGEINEIKYEVKYSIFNKSEILYSKENITIRRIKDKKNGIPYILLDGKLDSGDKIYIRLPITPIQDSVNISNRFIYIIGIATIVLGAIAITFITERFTKPIEELNDIANEMSNLNFKRKYRINDSEDEIDELGKSINTLSDKLEETINQLKVNNSELEKDIEEKSKIDEMRKQFISDVSHELKTPIALIQGYAEGLVENVNTDEENRKFYSEVILDEANKMDKLVKRLLELMKLEYEDRKFNDAKFDIVELINEVVKNSKVVLNENNIEVEFKEKQPIYVYADDFYIEQVVTNYFTNAIKNISEINGNKKIRIAIKKGKEIGKLRVTVFNTGKNIDQENINRIWTRFYKVDESRNRSKGGTGIGLALVKAIMTKYKSNYGVTNKKDGVEFYFEIPEAK